MISNRAIGQTLGFIGTLLLALVIAALSAPAAQAGGTGHYFAGLPNARDTLMPQLGFYFNLYSTYYRADRFYNPEGHRTDSVELPNGNKVDVNAMSTCFCPLWTPRPPSAKIEAFHNARRFFHGL